MHRESPRMPARGTHGIEYRCRYAHDETNPKHPLDALVHFFQSSVQPIPPDAVAYEEQAQHFQQSVSSHKLPHAFDGSLHQELMHSHIPVCISQPSGEILFRDAIRMRLCPPCRLQRSRKICPCPLLPPIQHHRHQDAPTSQGEQPFVVQSPEQWQHHAHHRIERQDVTTPNQQ